MEIGTKHNTLKCNDKTCQRFGKPLRYSKKWNRFVCLDTLIAEGEQ